jgi:elongation factor P
MEISRNSGYQMEVVKLDKRKMQYLYNSGDALVFMDQNTYDQIEIPVERMEWESKLLRGDEEVDVVLYNDEVMGVSLPSKVALTITECEPAVKGDTVNKAMKVAILETGLQIKVPLFISQGEVVLVRTDNGEYDGRA